MAVVHESDVGCFLDHNKFIQEGCGSYFKKIFFELRTPFLKDLEAAAEAKAIESGKPRVKKHKRQHPKALTPIEESLALNFIAELKDFLESPPSASDYYKNNKSTREAVDSFLSSIPGAKFEDVILELSDKNDTDSVVEKQYYEEHFLLPPHSTFFKLDVAKLSILVEVQQTFPLIVIDPPWTNRFVKRKRRFDDNKGYHSMGDIEYASLPVKDLCREGTLVAIWCTNSPTHQNTIRDTLLPAWDLRYVATWFWIKITTSGQFVCHWSEPNGKHPFEPIIIARRETVSEEATYPNVPDRKLVVSVPCAFHSFKPPLTRILKPFLFNDEGPYLELFARSLTPNTVSWGNQVPLLQHVNLFEQSSPENLQQSP